jgi:hypothetical protein
MPNRTAISRILGFAAGLALTATTLLAQADVWSPACTPDLIHMYPDRLAARCQENGKWYYLWYADHPNGHVERVARALQAVQLSGKKVQFHDVGQQGGNPNDRRFTILALIK